MTKKIIKIVIFLFLIFGIIAFSINLCVITTTKDQIITKEEYEKLENIDCIIVLGAGIWNDKPSPMLQDRLDSGISLYKTKNTKIIMSGDHGTKYHDEVNVMKTYAINNNVPSEDIFMDHAGFSTYDSIYRAKEIFSAKKIIIVTQKYHLFRALHIANALGLEAYGVNSDPRKYTGNINRELREIAARNKDFLFGIIKPQSTYLGEKIKLNQSGDITNDK